MNVATWAGGLALAAVVVLAQPSIADQNVFEGVKTAKAVWDVTVGDEKLFTDRMGLIKQTADMLKKRGITPEFVVLIRGPATKFVSKSLAGTKFAKDKVEKMAAVQDDLKALKDAGIPVEVCAIAMSRTSVGKDNVQPFAVIADNVLENIVVLQNKGYAYMPVDK